MYIRDSLQVVGPHTGSIDDLLRTDLKGLVGHQVARGDTHDPLAHLEEALNSYAARDMRAICGGRAGERGNVTGIIDLGIAVAQPAPKRMWAKPRSCLLYTSHTFCEAG